MRQLKRQQPQNNNNSNNNNVEIDIRGCCCPSSSKVIPSSFCPNLVVCPFPRLFLRSHIFSLNLIIIRPAVVYGVGANGGLSKQKHLAICSFVLTFWIQGVVLGR